LSRFLAIDWDQQQLHVVAGDVRGGVVTFRRATVWREERSPTTLADAEELGRLLRQRLKEAGIAPAPVLACVGRDRVVVKEVRYPAVPEAEEPAIVRFQALKELTESPDDVVLDFAPLGENAGERRASVFSLRRELLAVYQKVCQVAGLKLAGLTPRPFGLAAAAAAPVVPADVAVALIAASDSWAEFCVVRGGTLLFSRPLTPGTGLAAEVRRNLSVVAGQQIGQRLEAVYVAGAADTPLTRRLAETLELQVHSFDPFGGATGDMLPTGERGSFAGAAGLLLAKAKSVALPVNFVQPRQPPPPKRVDARLVVAVAVLVLAIFGGAGFAGHSFIERKNREKEEKVTAGESLDNQLTAAKEVQRHLQPLDAWESPVWLDELYDLSARIRDVDALRVTQLSAEPLPRNSKSRYTSRVRIRGTLRDDRAPLDRLVDDLRKDGHYGPDAVKVTGGNQFELTVDVARRAPDEYKSSRLAGGPGR
jgi:hypothetical protein